MGYLPSRAVQEARYYADIGYHEGPNNQNIFSQWQYGGAFNPWCDSFVCYCSWTAGFRFPSYSACGDKGEYNVGTHHRNAVRAGIWRPPSAVARPGWLAVFSWDVPDQHIEMVLSDQGGSQFATIGGNTGDAVLYRIRYRANLVGFIALDEAGQNAPNVPVGDNTVKTTDRTFALLNKAGTGEYVLGADGGVFAYNAPFHGAVPGTGTRLDMTKDWATSMLLTPDEGGYWVLTASGSIYSFGNAHFFGTFHGQLPLATAVRLVPSGAAYKAISSSGKLLTPKLGV